MLSSPPKEATWFPPSPPPFTRRTKEWTLIKIVGSVGITYVVHTHTHMNTFDYFLGRIIRSHSSESGKLMFHIRGSVSGGMYRCLWRHTSLRCSRWSLWIPPPAENHWRQENIEARREKGGGRVESRCVSLGHTFWQSGQALASSLSRSAFLRIGTSNLYVGKPAVLASFLAYLQQS